MIWFREREKEKERVESKREREKTWERNEQWPKKRIAIRKQGRVGECCLFTLGMEWRVRM